MAVSPEGAGVWSGVSLNKYPLIVSQSITFKGASEPREDQPTSGVMTSPNYPDDYPNNVNLARTIVVPKGNIIAMQLTHFALEREHDYVVITDGDPTRHREEDRTRLAKFHGGSSDWKYEIVSHTETVVVTFVTDGSVNAKGWRLEWGE